MTIQDLIQQYSKPELAQAEGMVYQVWEDGEITLQKSGSLLNQRTLHCITPGDPSKAVSLQWFPNQNRRGHAWIYTDKIGAQAVHEAILRGVNI